ncbi:MAG: hypothetical protein KDB53_00815 [Planctomycetes bacterium]|nr:hypothetical protein [Planctomycetota bacterium]
MKRAGVISGVIVPIALTIVPGWGHIWTRRGFRGFVIFALFAASLDYFLVAKFNLETLPFNPVIALAIAVAVHVFAFVDILRITFWLRSKTVQRRRSALFRKMVVHYLRGEYGQAQEACEGILRIDPANPAVTMWSGMIARECGRPKVARRLFQQARRNDERGYWKQEVVRELDALKEQPA